MTWPLRLYREPWHGQTYDAPSASVTVQPSCEQTASMAVNDVLLVRETRNGPATEFTSAAPPTSVSGDPAAVTLTAAPVNWPLRTARLVGVLLGPDGDDDEPSLLPHA